MWTCCEIFAEISQQVHARRPAIGLAEHGVADETCADRQGMASECWTLGRPEAGDLMATVSVRYIVNDVDEAMNPAPTFAMLSRGDLRLVLSVPGGGPGGGQAMPDGSLPTPGGWNRFSLEVEDLEAFVGRLRSDGAHFRNDIVTGVGGKQILLEDPSGNPIELFEPLIPEAKLLDKRG
jgi:catechol 2,3-dioxygenase-like lactoylglutathione lyase family enzyme